MAKFAGLDWVIVGGETGPGARPMHPNWARSLRDQCQAPGAAFFFKQWGAWIPAADLDIADPALYISTDSPRYHELKPKCAGNAGMIRVGKKRAGDLLDGKQYHEYPEVMCG
jgi:hypothetical protein